MGSRVSTEAAPAPGTPSERQRARMSAVQRALEEAQAAENRRVIESALAALAEHQRQNLPVDAATAAVMVKISTNLVVKPDRLKAKQIPRLDAVAKALQAAQQMQEEEKKKAAKTGTGTTGSDTRELDRDHERRESMFERWRERRTPLKYSHEDQLTWVLECAEGLLGNMLDYYQSGGVFTRRLAQYRAPKQLSDSVFPFPDATRARIVIVGDVGAENMIRDKVFRTIRAVLDKADAAASAATAIVHLGDIYYAGRDAECEEFLRAYNLAFDQATRPLFSIPGNHEGLAFFQGFYNVIVSGKTGPAGPASGNGQQRHSFFCLEYPQLKLMVVGIDTGLNSWPDSHKDDIDQTATLHPEEAKWVQDKLERAEREGYRAIVCSHHQLTSAFAPSPEFFEALAHQVLSTTTQPLLAWFWGHEHRLVVFDPARLAKVLPKSAYLARVPHMECVGHGSIPSPLDVYKNPIFRYRTEFQPTAYRYREHAIAQNGFVVVDVGPAPAAAGSAEPARVTVTHYDQDGNIMGARPRALPGFAVLPFS